MTASMLSSSQVSHHFCGRSVTIARGLPGRTSTHNWKFASSPREGPLLRCRPDKAEPRSFSPGLLHLSELSPVSAISLALPIRKGTVGPVVEQHTCSIGRVFADLGQLAHIYFHSQTRTLIGPQLAIFEIKD